jgi:hypothetical protein
MYEFYFAYTFSSPLDELFMDFDGFQMFRVGSGIILFFLSSSVRGALLSERLRRTPKTFSVILNKSFAHRRKIKKLLSPLYILVKSINERGPREFFSVRTMIIFTYVSATMT